MWHHHQLTISELKKLLRAKHIALAGNGKLKIYGLLTCSSGKRMKKGNRIFFTSEKEAIHSGYRPCGHCLKESYILWKNHISKKQVDCLVKATQF